MYFTHHFASHATLDRVRHWLHALGFSPASVEAHTDGIPRITVAVEPAWIPGIQMLIDSVERSDPRGRPGIWDVAHQAHVYPSSGEPTAVADARDRRSTAIGWHPFDSQAAAMSELDPVAQAMTRRWGRT